MSEKIFIDTDVLLDVILERKTFADDSEKVLSLAENNLVKAYTSALVLSNLYYIVSSHSGKKTAMTALVKLKSILHILPVGTDEINSALHSGFADFEDALQYFTALSHNIPAIITRNIRDFRKAQCKVFTPADFVRQHQTKKTRHA